MPPPAPVTSTARNSPVPFDIQASPVANSPLATDNPVGSSTVLSDSYFRQFQQLLVEDRRTQMAELKADRLAMRQEQQERDERLRNEQRERDERFQQTLITILAGQRPTAQQNVLPVPQQGTSTQGATPTQEFNLNSPPLMEAIRQRTPSPPRREKERPATTGEKVCSSGGLSQPGPSHVADMVPTSPPPSRKRRAGQSPTRINARTKRLKGGEYIPLDEMDIAMAEFKPMETLPDRQGVRDNFTKALTTVPGWFPLTLSVGAYVVIRFMYAHERARWTTYFYHCDKGHKQPDYRKPFHWYGGLMAQCFDSFCQNKYNKVVDKPDLALRDFIPWFKMWKPEWTRPYICSTSHHLKSAKSMRVHTDVGFFNRFLADIGCPDLEAAEDILRSTDDAVLPQDNVTRDFLDQYTVDEPSIAELWPNHLPRAFKTKKLVCGSSTDTDGPGPSQPVKKKLRKKAKARRSPVTVQATVPAPSANTASTTATEQSKNVSQNTASPCTAGSTPPKDRALVIAESPVQQANASEQQDSSPVQFTSGSLSPTSKQANLQDKEREESDDATEGNIFSDTILNFCEELLK